MSAFPEHILDLAETVLAKARALKWKIATAESCTGGLLASALTEIPGSSDVFERGFVTYSNEAKHEMLNVSSTVVEAHGAVSPEVAGQMADGAIMRSQAHLAVSLTGIAGPGGGSEKKPVGLVYMGAKDRNGRGRVTELRFGDIGRHEVRMKAVEAALHEFLCWL